MSDVQFQDENNFTKMAASEQKSTGLSGWLMKVTGVNNQQVKYLMIGIIIVMLVATFLVIKYF